MTFVKQCGTVTIVAAAVAAIAGFAIAEQPAPATATTTATKAAGTAQPFQVRVEGTGRPMILIPGLTCDGTVWNATVAHFKGKYQCHVLSLAGFAGVPPVQGPFIPTMRDAILQYIRVNRLQRPTIIGHSLGGHLALAVSVAAPLEIGPIVVVDGGAATGALMFPGAKAEAIASQSAMMKSAMAAMPQQAFAAQNAMMISQMVQNPKTAEALAQVTGRSDVKTVATAMHEIMTADLRQSVAGIQSPVLMIGATELARDATAQAATQKRYEDQVAKIPNHKVIMNFEARHFVMLDKPEWFYKVVGDFLSAR